MKKNWLKKRISRAEKSLENSRQLKRLQPYLTDSLWEFDCKSIARGVAAGLAGCVIPGFQIFYAAILAIILRGNLPVALISTFVTNPFTALPMVYFIHLVGKLIIGNDNSNYAIQEFQWNFSSFSAFWSSFSNWILQFGKAFLIGLPIVSAALALIGYFGTIFIWKSWEFLFHKRKK